MTAQTTIEYHGNRTKRKRAKKKGEIYINHYDLGYVRNWKQVFGTGNVFMSVLPSLRKPPWPPYPSIRRHASSSSSSSPSSEKRPHVKRMLNMNV